MNSLNAYLKQFRQACLALHQDEKLHLVPYFLPLGIVLACLFRMHFLLTWMQTPSIPGHLFLTVKGAAIERGEPVAFRWKGDKYYPAGALFIKFVSTHEDYEQINVETVEHKA